jgi:uncharacterized protein (DUF427 family)
MPPTEPSAFVDRFDYRVDLLPRRNRVTVTAGDVLLAETIQPLLVDEQDHGLVFYVPVTDVHLDRLTPIEHTSRCPFKGTARHWALAGGDDTPVAWAYEDPYPEVARIGGHLAFYQDRVTVSIGQAPYIGRR